MFESQQLDELASRLAQVLPAGLKSLRGELESGFRTVLENNLDKLDLVSREQFEVSQAQLEATQVKLNRLEATVSELEKRDSHNTEKEQEGRQAASDNAQ